MAGLFGMGTTVLWLAAMIILLVVEGMAPGLVSIWFALGALAAMIGAVCKASLPIQIVLFILVSVLALIVTRPLVKKYVNAKVQRTNADSIIGQECVVTEQIDNLAETGAVKVAGKLWTARTADSTVIPKETRVVVERIEGVKANAKQCRLSKIMKFRYNETELLTSKRNNL